MYEEGDRTCYEIARIARQWQIPVADWREFDVSQCPEMDFIGHVKTLRNEENRTRFAERLAETLDADAENVEYSREMVAAFTRVLCERVGDPEADSAVERWTKFFLEFADEESA